jgi:hypothetical protein
LSFLERLLGGPTRDGQRFRITVGMKKAVQQLGGADSALSDPVLSSPSAASAVVRYLRQVAGIDPGSRGDIP